MTANRPRPPITVEAKVRAAAAWLEKNHDNFASILYGRALYPINWALGPWNPKRPTKRRGLGKLLPSLLQAIAAKIGCEVQELRCDHDPALRPRPYNPRIKNVAARYTPNANDPAALVWRPQPAEFEGSHHVKTNVRGERGQFSDVALIKRERRREREKKAKKRKPTFRQVTKKIEQYHLPKPKHWSGGKIPARVKPWPKGRKIETRKSR